MNLNRENGDVLVSVVCIAFNHEKYIRRALDSVLDQKTDFKYEIIIHDDASTDSTRDIISEYVQEYKNIISIYEKENLYSQGKNIIEPCLPYVKSKYMIILECDDFWLDHRKLQKQVDFLEKKQECPACAHQTIEYNAQTGETRLFSIIRENRDLTTKDVIANNMLYHVSSLLFRTNMYEELLRCLDGINWTSITDDYALEIMCTFWGKVHYSSEIMSLYRKYSSEESWTYQYQVSGDAEKNSRRLLEGTIDLLHRFDVYTNQKYHKVIEIAIASRVWGLHGYHYVKGDLK